MSVFVRVAGPLTCLMIAAGIAPAATPGEINAAIKKGTDALKVKYTQGGGVGALGVDAGHGIGPTCLAGLAMLEGGVPVTDPAMKTVTDGIRNAAYKQVKTYQVALCLLYLDRFGDPADVPLIQILAVRLLAGQTGNGGWGYDCVGSVQQTDEQWLRAIKAVKQPGTPKLHPDVEKYAQSIAANARPQLQGIDDNSNTQFAVIAVWLARKHGVPVDGALDLVEKRFMSTQSSRTGGWGYNGPLPGISGDGPTGSPAMYCAGLIGLATSIGRREERRLKSETPKKDDPSKADPKKTSDDPFFNPPQKSNPEPKKPAPKPLDARDLAVKAAFTGLGAIVAQSAQAGQGALIAKTDAVLGHHDLYFLWSLERTCVIYGAEKVGGVNWYEAGAHALVVSQSQNGTWGGGGGGTAGYGAEVNTSFAVLFLCRSNLARDLSGKVQKENGTEMRAGTGPGSTETKTTNPAPGTNPNPVPSGPIIPGAAGSEAATLAAELVRATDKDWATVLRKLRDSKGSTYTEALVTATNRLEGDRLKAAREALAERLTRMTAETLRSMAKSEEAELRRASLLAMAMKDDKNHIPDLIAAILDDEEFVVRAAKAGLKSLSGQDFGPAANANVGEKKLAVDAWQNWWSKQKK